MFLAQLLRKDVSNRIGAESIITTKPNKITLNNPVERRKAIKTMWCNMSAINPRTAFAYQCTIMRFIDFDQFLVERQSLGADEKVAWLDGLVPQTIAGDSCRPSRTSTPD